MRRVVKPPPKVIPKIEENSSLYNENQLRNDINPSNDPEFEALIQQEMKRLEKEFEKELLNYNINYSSPISSSSSSIVTNIPPSIGQGIDSYSISSNDKLNHIRNDISNMYSEESYNNNNNYSNNSNNSNNNYDNKYNHDGYNYDTSYQSPRRAKGNLNELYGPSDDRQNMKAAKAAAYSHQLEVQRNQQQQQHQQQQQQYPYEHRDYGNRNVDDRNHERKGVEPINYNSPSRINNNTNFNNNSNIPSYPARSTSNERGGLNLGKDELDEKALRKQRQLEYKKQLDAQTRLQNEQKEIENTKLNRQQQTNNNNDISYSSQQYESPQSHKQKQNIPYQDNGYNNNNNNNNNNNQNPYQNPQNLKNQNYSYDSPPQNDQRSMRQYESQQQQQYPPQNMNRNNGNDDNFNQYSKYPQTNERNNDRNTNNMDNNDEFSNNIPQRFHLKGATGKVNVESRDLDKAQKRKQQEEYRRQLELQAKDAAERKEREKKKIEEEDAVREGRVKKGNGKDHQEPKNRNDDQYSNVSYNDKIDEVNDPYDDERRYGQDQRREFYQEDNRRDYNENRSQGPPNNHNNNSHNNHNHNNNNNNNNNNNLIKEPSSPGKSPTKARNRLINDVYGGGINFSDQSDPIGKISMRGIDKNDAKKRAAILEQQQALEEQIAEKNRLKELEKQKQKLEDEKELNKGGNGYFNQDKAPSNSKKPQSQKDDDRTNSPDEMSKMRERAQNLARDKLQQLKNSNIKSNPNSREYDGHNNSRNREYDDDNNDNNNYNNDNSIRNNFNNQNRRNYNYNYNNDNDNDYNDDGNNSNYNNDNDGYNHNNNNNNNNNNRDYRNNSSKHIKNSPSPSSSPKKQSSSQKKLPPRPPAAYPLLQDLGLHPAETMNNDYGSTQRGSTPGELLQSESYHVPIKNEARLSNNQRDSERDDNYHRYRQNIDEEDRLLVDWQHQRGYSIRRGTTPVAPPPSKFQLNDRYEQSFVSNSKFLGQSADPWGPDGLLSVFSGNTHTSQSVLPQDSSIIEKSLVSDSLFMLIDPPTKDQIDSAKKNPFANIDKSHLNSNEIIDSPLSKFVNSHSTKHLPVTSPQKPKSPYKSVIPIKYDPRQSDEQLDQLISQSKTHISRNLLLETNEYEYFQNPSIKVDPSRPLTSAGRKVVSKESQRVRRSSERESDVVNNSPVEEVIVVPRLRLTPDKKSHSNSNINTEQDENGDILLNSCGSFRVQSVSDVEKQLMKELMDKEEINTSNKISPIKYDSVSSKSNTKNNISDLNLNQSSKSDIGRPTSRSNVSRSQTPNKSQTSSSISLYSPNLEGSKSRPSSRSKVIPDPVSSRPTSNSSINKTQTQNVSSRISSDNRNSSSSRPSSRPSSNHSEINSSVSKSEYRVSSSQSDQLNRPISRQNESRNSSRGGQESLSRPTSSHNKPLESYVGSNSRPSSNRSNSQPNSRQSSRSRWNVSENVKQATISSLRDHEHSQRDDEYPSYQDSQNGYQIDNSNKDNNYNEEGDYEYHNQQELQYHDPRYGNGYQEHDQHEESYEDYYNAYDDSNNDTEGGGYYDQDGNLINPHYESSDEEQTGNKSDYLRNLAL